MLRSLSDTTSQVLDDDDELGGKYLITLLSNWQAHGWHILYSCFLILVFSFVHISRSVINQGEDGKVSMKVHRNLARGWAEEKLATNYFSCHVDDNYYLSSSRAPTGWFTV